MKTIFFVLCLAVSFGCFAQENYLAKFHTLNSHINGIVAGSSTIHFTPKHVKTFVRLFAGSPGTWHMQNVFVGDRCPGIQDDVNFDGFIDIQEAHRVVGSVIIPMDGDISSQKAGTNIFPKANESGTYTYDKEAKLKKFMKDLREEDKNLNDIIMKLAPYQDLNIEGMVVIIQGVSQDLALPPSVATYGGRKNFQTLPVACGVFRRTN